MSHTHQDIPKWDAPDAAFLFTDPDERDAALKWARAILADKGIQPDRQLTRACRVVILNDARNSVAETMLLAVLDPAEARHDAA